MPGMGELVIILLIVLVVFGANKLPQIGDALGRSIKNFKRSSKVEGDDDDEKDKKVEELAEKKPAQIASKPQKQLEPAGDNDEAEWEEVVVRRRKKSASSSES
jgi:sec-independent protein translocase protein TatA